MQYQISFLSNSNFIVIQCNMILNVTKLLIFIPKILFICIAKPVNGILNLRLIYNKQVG